MIVRTYRACCFAEYNHSHCKVFEQDPSFSGPPGIFDWRLVSSLGTGSVFVGQNYPINQDITDDKDHDGSMVSFIRQNCVYTAYHASLHAPYRYVPPRSAAQSRREGRKYQTFFLKPKYHTSTCWLEFPPPGTHLVQAVSQSPQLNKS